MTTPLIPQDDFNQITQLIHAARQRAVQAVNITLIELYWQVGQFISRKIAQGGMVRRKHFVGLRDEGANPTYAGIAWFYPSQLISVTQIL